VDGCWVLLGDVRHCQRCSCDVLREAHPAQSTSGRDRTADVTVNVRPISISTFLFAKEIISIGERDYFYRRKRLFLSAKEIISIGERDYFYRRKNFGHSAGKKKAGDG